MPDATVPRGGDGRVSLSLLRVRHILAPELAGRQDSGDSVLSVVVQPGGGGVVGFCCQMKGRWWGGIHIKASIRLEGGAYPPGMEKIDVCWKQRRAGEWPPGLCAFHR